MLKLIITFFRFFFAKPKSRVSSLEKEVSQSNTETSTIPLQEPIKQERSITFFSRRNDLVNEFSYEPTPVYGSVFGSNEERPKPIGWLQASGIVTTEKYGNKLIESMDEEDKEWDKSWRAPEYKRKESNIYQLTSLDLKKE